MKTHRLIVLLLLCLSVIVFVPASRIFAHNGPHVRIAHLTAAVPAVDIYVNGELTVKNLKYKDVTDYLSLDGGDFEFALVPAGGQLKDTLTAKPISLSFTASEGKFFTVAAIGSPKDNSLELFKLPADRSVEAGGTEAPDEDATAAATQTK